VVNLCHKNPFWEGARWCEMSSHESKARNTSVFNLPYTIGYWILGPLFTTFIHTVINRIAQHQYQMVLFPAREGFLLKQLYDILFDAEIADVAPIAHYVFLSRKSTFLPSCDCIGERELTRGHEKFTTLRIILSKLNLNIELIQPLINKFSFYQIDDTIERPGSNAELQKFLQNPNFLSLFKNERDLQRRLLYEYLDQFGFWQISDAAIVDVGWVGTIQESLAKAFSENEKMPSLHGYYMALLQRASVPVLETQHLKQHAIFFDYRTERNPAIIDRFTELLENAARAPHGSTIGYRRTSDAAIVPVLKPMPEETHDSSLIASLQAGILEYAQAYKTWMPFKLSEPETCSSYHLAQWERLTRFPSTREAKLLRSILHTNEFVDKAGSSKQPEFKSALLPRLRFFFNRQIIWPEGFYAGLKLPGANILFNLYRLLRNSPY
jgi:predicted HAD superfamily hydrolase